MLRKTSVALGVAALALSSAALAQSTPEPQRLSEITVSATRTERETDSVPNTVSVYKQQTLTRRDAPDLRALLDGEVDLAVRSAAPRFTAAGASAGRAGNEGINIRGLEGNQVLMMVDGIRLPQSFSFGAFASGRADYIDMTSLSSVEVLRGPASAQFGSDGLAGALSLSTLAPDDLLKNGMTFAGFVSSSQQSTDKAWKLSGAVAGASGDWQGLLMLTNRRGHEIKNQGENTAANATRTAPNPSDTSSNTLLAKAGLRVNAQHRLMATLEARTRRTDTEVLSARAASVSASTPSAVIDLDARDKTQRQRFSLEHRYEDLNAPWLQSLKTQVYVQSSETTQYSAEDRYVSADRTRYGSYKERLIGLSSQAQTQLASQRLSYGLDLSRNRIEGLRDGTVPPSGESFPSKPFPNTDFTMAGAFVQDEIDVGNLSLIPGLRYERYSLQPQAQGYSGNIVKLSDQAVTPRLGLIWRAGPGLQPYLQWALGFRAPTPDQVNNGFANPAQGYKTVGNDKLKAEHANSVELGLRGQWAETWRWQLSAYRNSYRDFISQQLVSGAGTVADPSVFQYINLNKAHIEGAEARLIWQATQALNLSAAWAQARGYSSATGVDTPLDTVQPQRLSLTARYEKGDWGLWGQWQHSAAKDASRISASSYYATPSYRVLDIGGDYRLTPTLNLSVAITNLSDSKYWRWSDVRGIAANSTVLDAYTAPGRQFQISARADF